MASRAGVGRATAYSYFASKDAIIVELADALERSLESLTSRMGPLGAEPYGVANLRWWIGEFVDLYLQNSALFLLWTELLPGRPEPIAPSGDLVIRFAETVRLRSRPGPEPRVPDSTDLPTICLAVLSSIERIGEFANLAPAVSQPLIDALTASVQCTLYPHTTAEQLYFGLGRDSFRGS
ncbi:TetR/AcrR family transcriptional regulator [Mycobacterium sp. SMC-8]|uniref:TetR/AcrR family transcriptional regulator n=1 Tax=Mycobacterium sp. SMC-8 TaxID=2857060 RepID=UPI0021B3DAA6|nr:TetR/AcrR family transcriptional regulator [Mycobacterium sp. SMC-8]UXA11576.1 TetR/AcrR family transcriptional regulator [Mycobacterium sp. SMC-8]